jgi:hypothetical protein
MNVARKMQSTPANSIGNLGDSTRKMPVIRKVPISYKSFAVPLWVIICCSANPSLATSVIVLRTPRHVVLVADSLFGTDAGTRLGCKIIHSGSIFFASAGVDEDAQSDFFVNKIAQRAIADAGGDIEKAAKLFADYATPAFSKTATQIRRESPAFYRLQVKCPPEPLQVAFVGVRRFAPIFVIITFTINETATEVIAQNHQFACPGSMERCPKGIDTEALGENAAARRLIRLGGEDDLGWVKRLIESEIEDAPTKVGRPISVLEVDAHGSKWICKGKCK